MAFDVGKKEEALALMGRALTEADGLDPKAGLKEAYLKSVQIAAILYMRGAAADFPVARQARVYGMCSDPDPNEWFRNRPQAQRNFAWYELAELEAEVTDGHAVLDELRRRTRSGSAFTSGNDALFTGDRCRHSAPRPRPFPGGAKDLSPGLVVGVKTFLTGVGDPLNMPEGQLSPISTAEWTTADIAATTRSAVMAFMLTAAAAGRDDVLAAVRQKLDAVPGLRDVVRPLFETMDDPSNLEKDLEVIIPSIAGRLLKDDIVDTVDVFMSAVYTLQFLEGSVLAGPVAEALMKVYERLWPEILKKRTFSMISPSTNGPIIVEALRKGETAKQRMAHMVLAAEPAVNRNLEDVFVCATTENEAVLQEAGRSEDDAGTGAVDLHLCSSTLVDMAVDQPAANKHGRRRTLMPWWVNCARPAWRCNRGFPVKTSGWTHSMSGPRRPFSCFVFVSC